MSLLAVDLLFLFDGVRRPFLWAHLFVSDMCVCLFFSDVTGTQQYYHETSAATPEMIWNVEMQRTLQSMLEEHVERDLYKLRRYHVERDRHRANVISAIRFTPKVSVQRSFCLCTPRSFCLAVCLACGPMSCFGHPFHPSQGTRIPWCHLRADVSLSRTRTRTFVIVVFFNDDHRA